MSGMMAESTFPEIMHYEGKSLPDLTIISQQDTQASKKPRNSFYKNTGGLRLLDPIS